MDEGTTGKPVAAQFSSEPQPVAIEYVPGHVRMFNIAEEKLDLIASGGTTLNVLLTFFGVCFGALVSLGCILLTSPPDSSKKYAVTVALFVVSVIGTILFGIIGGLAYGKQRASLKAIKGC